jgi:hypothetical protein
MFAIISVLHFLLNFLPAVQQVIKEFEASAKSKEALNE